MDSLRILITNDDGPLSPSLLPFIRAVSQQVWSGELQIVVPSEEQSWISQAISRFRTLEAKDWDAEEFSGQLITGTPADCVGLALGNLFPDKADIILSGINIGSNAGIPFFYNSGTVGAARQAVVMKKRSIAFSIHTPKEIFQMWSNRDFEFLESHNEDWNRLASISAKLAGELITATDWEEIDSFSVNLPWEAEESTERVLTQLEEASYLKLFSEAGDRRYQHQLDDLEYSGGASADCPLPGDISTIVSGKISITPVCYRTFTCQMATVEQLRERLSSGRQ